MMNWEISENDTKLQRKSQGWFTRVLNGTPRTNHQKPYEHVLDQYVKQFPIVQ